MVLAGLAAPVGAHAEAAESDRSPVGYVAPELGLHALHATGRVWARFSAGGAVGARGLVFRPRILAWHVRGSAGVLGNPQARSAGADGRIGLYAEILRRRWTLQQGVEFFRNGYGTPVSEDYYLPPSGGSVFHNAFTVHASDKVNFGVWADPGWVQAQDRWADLWPLQELGTGVGVDARVGSLVISLQRCWQWNFSGMQRQVVLSVSAPLVWGRNGGDL